VGIAQRARHPEELKRDPDKYMIDIDYYLSQQVLTHCHMFFLFEKKCGCLSLCCIIYSVSDLKLLLQIHPVVSRLCASIQGTSPARLAECLGLDSSKVLIFC